MRHKHTKPQTDRAIKKSISMPLSMFVRASQIQQQEFTPTFSDYLQALIRADIQNRDPIHR